MYHHRLWSSMSVSIRRGIMSRSITKKGLLGNPTTPPPPVTKNQRWCSSLLGGGRGSLPNSTTPPPPPVTKNQMWCSSLCMTSPPPTPYMFLSPTYKGKFFAVFNPSDRRWYDLPIPKELQGPDTSVRGSGHGWMLMMKSTNNNYAYEEEEEEGTVYRKLGNQKIVSLYNPMTTTHIPLPSLPADFLVGAVVWCNPAKASRGQPVVSITCGLPRWQILLYQQGNDQWSQITSPSPNHIIEDTAYHEAEATLYVVYSDCRLSVLDLATWTLRPVIHTPSPEIQSLGGHGLSLLVGPAGDLLLFVMTDEECKGLFKLDRRCLKWVRTTGVGGDHTVFMADNTVSMVCDPGFTDARPNQIYYFDLYRARRTGNNSFEIPTYVQVWDITPAAGSSNNGNKKIFKTTKKILAGKPNHLEFASWIVPSLE